MRRTTFALLASPLLLGLSWYFIAVPYLQRSARAFERSYKIEEPLARVRGGEIRVSVYDTELLHLLAEDKSCVRNLRQIYFNSVSLTEDDGISLNKLENLTEIGFYCCKNVDPLATTMSRLPLKLVWFELADISPNAIKTLGTGKSIQRISIDRNLSEAQVNALREMPPTVAIESTFPLNAYD